MHFRWRNHLDVGGCTEEAFGFKHALQVGEAGSLRRLTHQNLGVAECSVGIQSSVGLSNNVLLFFVGGHVLELLRDFAVFNFEVWRFDETKAVDTGVVTECTNESNVWTFWSFNRAHTAIVREVDVSNFEASALTAESTRPECRQTTTVGDSRQWVHLVHQLRQLAGSEELFDRC